MLEFADVINLNDFYKTKLPEIMKIKNLITSIRLLYNLPPSRISLQVSEGDRVYRIVMRDSKKNIFGWFVYSPLQKTLELYDPEYPKDLPLIMWKDKRIKAENYYRTLGMAGVAKTFNRITSSL